MTKKAFRPDVDAPEWKGGHTPYDIIKEGTIALLVIALLTLIFAVVFGSPDEAAITIKSWSNADPIDFATTALSELNGTSISASYGAPYNHNGASQQIGPLQLAKWVGVAHSHQLRSELRHRAPKGAAERADVGRGPQAVLLGLVKHPNGLAQRLREGLGGHEVRQGCPIYTRQCLSRTILNRSSSTWPPWTTRTSKSSPRVAFSL